MTVMITELYDALKDAGADDEKARKAAQTVAAYETRLGRIEGKLTVLLAAVGVNAAASIACFGMLVTMSGRLGEISGQLTQIAQLLHH